MLRYRGTAPLEPEQLRPRSCSCSRRLASRSSATSSATPRSANAVIWTVGLLVASRARILHVSLTYAASASRCWPRLRSAIVGTPLLAEVAPLTGPMYQLLVFFMLTDPRTTPSRRRAAASLTVAHRSRWSSALIRLANDFDVAWAAVLFAPAPPILALALVGPIALALDLRRRARAEEGPAPHPAAARA